MGILGRLFGKKQPDVKGREEGFWRRAEIFTLKNAGFDKVEPLIQAEGAHFVAIGVKVRFDPGSEKVLFLKKDSWTSELVETEQTGDIFRWKVSFMDYDESRLKRADFLDMNVLLLTLETGFKNMDPNVEIVAE